MNDFATKMMMKTLSPMLDKALTDEKLSEVFTEFEKEYPLAPGEVKLVGTISLEKDGKVYFCIAALDKDMKIVSIKKQWKFIEGIKHLFKITKDEQ